ncbi:MAG TPA: hypothetical protein VJ508_17585, partial [Saprospiraceae bacterium]|nr:hypothetical protein [Saprospiraceae bacterium]
MMTIVFGLTMVISLTSAIGANAAPAAIKLTYDQCASGTANPFTCTTATGGTNGGWIGSLVGNSNSNYVEGMAVPQRPIFNNIAGGTHTFIWYMSFNNGNAHGYDFITSISQAQQLAIDYAGAAYNIDLCANPPSGFTYAACQAIISGPNHYTVNVPEDPYLSGIGTLTTAVQYRLNSFDARYGHRYIDIYADAPISPTFSFTLRHCPNFSPTGCPLGNGLDTTSGQTFIEYTLVFTSAGAANVIIPYAGHLGLSANPLIDGIGWGSYGAGSINGAAWHMKGPTLDGSGGSQDNQVNLQSATLYPFDTVTSKTTLLGGLVHDVVTLTDSLDKNPPLITGTMDYYLCFLNTGGISPTINSGLADGCFSKTG